MTDRRSFLKATGGLAALLGLKVVAPKAVEAEEVETVEEALEPEPRIPPRPVNYDEWQLSAVAMPGWWSRHHKGGLLVSCSYCGSVGAARGNCKSCGGPMTPRR